MKRRCIAGVVLALPLGGMAAASNGVMSPRDAMDAAQSEADRALADFR